MAHAQEEFYLLLQLVKQNLHKFLLQHLISITFWTCPCLHYFTIHPSIRWDHTLYRALVLLKLSPWLLGTILDGSPLRHRIPASWHSFCQPRKDDRQSQPHLVLIQQPRGILTQDPRIPSPPPEPLSQHQAYKVSPLYKHVLSVNMPLAESLR